MAAVMNFVGAFLGQKVAHTVSDVIVPGGSASHGLVVVMAGLFGAIGWNLVTWYYGLPSSSSHALIGGLVGSAIVSGSLVHWSVIVDKVVIPMVASPLVGFALAFLLMLAIMWIWRRRNPHRTNRGFRLAQTVSAAAMALGHGLQDAQKTMGVIFLALLTGGDVAPAGGLPAGGGPGARLAGRQEGRGGAFWAPGAGGLCRRAGRPSGGGDRRLGSGAPPGDIPGWWGDQPRARPPHHPPAPASGVRVRGGRVV